MSNGFDRLRLGTIKGAAASCVLGLGALAGGSVRATTVSLPQTVSRSAVVTGTKTVTGNWKINHILLPSADWSGISTSAGFNAMKTAVGNDFRAAVVSDAILGGVGDAFDQGMIWGFANGYLFGTPGGSPDLIATVTTDADGGVTLSTGVENSPPSVWPPGTGFYPLATPREGLLTEVEYYLPPDSMIMRVTYTMHSDFKADQDISTVIGGNLAANENTTVQGTSSGDEILEDSDRWFVTNDNPNIGGDPVSTPTLVISRHGIDSPLTPINQYSPGSGLDLFLSRYDLTVPVDQTRRIVVFVSAHDSVTAAIAQGSWFESTLNAAAYGLADPALAQVDPLTGAATGLLTGMTAEEITTIANYPADGEGDLIPDTVDNCPVTINTSQINRDGDSAGDACDAFPLDPTETTDTDADGVGDNSDNCLLVKNTDQLDSDGDGRGDACDEPAKKGGSLGLPALLALLLGGMLPRLRRPLKNSRSQST